LTAINLLYVPWTFKDKRYNLFFGGGFGQLEVPRSEEQPEQTEKGLLFNLEAGINYRVFWKFGLYGLGKYLYAQKKVNWKHLINFNEFIVLIGITFDFGI